MNEEFLKFLAKGLSEYYVDGFELSLFKDQRCGSENWYLTEDRALEIIKKISEEYEIYRTTYKEKTEIYSSS